MDIKSLLDSTLEEYYSLEETIKKDTTIKHRREVENKLKLISTHLGKVVKLLNNKDKEIYLRNQLFKIRVEIEELDNQIKKHDI